MRRRQQQRVENIRLLVSVDVIWSKSVRGVRSGHAARPTAISTCSSRIGVLLTAQIGYSRSFGRSCTPLRSVVGVYSICPYSTAPTRKKNALAELSREAQTLLTSGAAPARAKVANRGRMVSVCAEMAEEEPQTWQGGQMDAYLHRRPAIVDSRR